MNDLRISLLHLALKPGDLATNYASVESGIRVAAASGADLAVAPELCISGYEFIEAIGTDWIASCPDEWTTRICYLAQSLKLAVLFGHAERGEAGKFYNTSLMIDATGTIIGHHRKINTHAEPWASPGDGKAVTNWNGLKFGMLICSDAYTGDVATALQSKGAQLLVSPAAWAPGLYGPEGEWEERTRETGLPLIVCNRTGKETKLNFCGGESLVIKHGRRLLSHSSPRSAVLSFSWDLQEMLPTSKEFEITYL
jgi:5-aminopentanamidase